MMTTEQIAKTVITKSHTPQDSSLRMALIYKLYKEGYKTQYISDAMNYHRSAVPLACQKVSDLLKIGDKIMSEAIEQLDGHTIRLSPYFEKNEVTYNVKARLEIDDVKLLY